MKEKIQVVYGGARPLYEVIESDDEISVTIRYAGDHKEQIRLHRSGVAALVSVLKDLKPLDNHPTRAVPEQPAAAAVSASH